MSQKELAESLEVSLQQINKILKGRENLNLQTISKIEKCLDMDLIHFPKVKIKRKRV